jgi:hypothetical protein
MLAFGLQEQLSHIVDRGQHDYQSTSYEPYYEYCLEQTNQKNNHALIAAERA